MASLSLKSGALTGLRTPAASCVCLARSRNRYAASILTHLPPNAAIRLSRRCRPMPASSSMTARAVANGSSPSRAIAACSALTVQCRARRHRATCVAACQRFNKCSEALNARSAIQWKIKRSRPIAAPGTGSQCFHQLALGCDARQVCGHHASRAGADAQCQGSITLRYRRRR
jgi:hypothetical protein